MNDAQPIRIARRANRFTQPHEEQRPQLEAEHQRHGAQEPKLIPLLILPFGNNDSLVHISLTILYRNSLTVTVVEIFGKIVECKKY